MTTSLTACRLVGRAIVALEQGKPLPMKKQKRGVNDISLNELFEREEKRKAGAGAW